MLNLSPKQLMRLWYELTTAYCGCNGFGGNTAEIYAYVLREDSPTRYLAKHIQEDILKSNTEAASTLARACQIFSENYTCKIQIDGLEPELWLAAIKDSFDHRAHVKVLSNIRSHVDGNL